MAAKTVAKGNDGKAINKIALYIECYYNEKGNIKMKKYYKQMEESELVNKK